MRENYQTMTKELAMKILGLPANYTENDLRTNYRKKMMLNHPDHNGDVRLAQEINLAYELLKSKYPSSSMTGPKLSYKELKIKELKEMVVGYDESLPKWVTEIYNIIKFVIDDIDIDLMNKNLTKEQIDRISNSRRNEVIRRLKEIEDVFCRYTGIEKNDLINEGYIPVNNYGMQYNIKDIYNRLLSATSKIFKERMAQVLNKYSNNYGALGKDIENKIAELTERLSTEKLDGLIAEFDTYLSNIYLQYEQDSKLLSELKNNYQDLLESTSTELNNLYALCGKKEFGPIYNELVTRLKSARKEQRSAKLVHSLNEKISVVLANTSSLQDTIRLNILYGKLLEAINNMELTNDVISLIDNISSNNIEQDIDDILHILDTKINNIYIPRFRTNMTIPLYVSCRLYNKEYILEMIYQDGIPQVVVETTFDDNKLIPIGEVLKSATFVGGTKTANVNNNNSVICEYNDPKLNRLAVVKNKNTNTIEVYGSKKYISYLNGNQPDEDLAKYKDIKAIITELTLKLTPSVKRYLYEESKKNNGRSK